MDKIVVQTRVSSELKAQAEAVFSGLGLSTAEAIRLFLQQSVNSQGLPFQPTLRRPSALLQQAFDDYENGDVERFSSVEDLAAPTCER